MRAHAAMCHRAPLSRIMVVLLAFLAIAIQSFVIQTHIHISQGAGRGESVSLVSLVAAAVTDRASVADDQGVPRDKYPINEDPSNCPLCQEFSHSGQFVASAAVLAALPFTVTVNFIVFEEALPAFIAVTHIWRGRAPPVA
jgi:hypothetical protein